MCHPSKFGVRSKRHKEVRKQTMPNTMHESDFKKRVMIKGAGEFLPGTSIEIIREPAGRGEYRHVLFDFDGTISLIREGWPEIMIPMCVEILMETPNHELPEEVRKVVHEFVSRLTGKQTIYQMMALVEEIEKRGGTPEEPLVYKQMYLDRLMELIKDRREALRIGKAKPVDMMVPGALDLLKSLKEKGMQMYLASGTDEPFVKDEAGLLGMIPYFGEHHVYGAIDGRLDYSKAMVIQRILEENKLDGVQLLGFGDAFVEIDSVKAVGGTGIGVASDEAGRSGKPDEWKRERLIGIGADIIIPDFREQAALMGYIFP